MQRRTFLKLSGMAGLALVLPPLPARRYVLYGDGKHDDTEALQAWFDHRTVYYADGSLVENELRPAGYWLSKTLTLCDSDEPRIVQGSYFQWTKNLDLLLDGCKGRNVRIESCYLMNGGFPDTWNSYRVHWLNA